jgi:hypothetical protein
VEQQDGLNEVLEEISESVFKNADKSNPVSTFEFASWLDPENLEDFFKNGSYKSFATVEKS